MTETPYITSAMVLAAGLGTRMRPITDTIPKPLVKVSGSTLLDHALDALAQGGVNHAVVNVHYLADQIEHHVEARRNPQIRLSDERGKLLDSGGGVKKAMRDERVTEFFILNADSFWVDGKGSTVSAMRDAWDSETMDLMLLVASPEQATGFDGRGDFFMDENARLTRRGSAERAPWIYAGAIIAKASLFDAIEEEVFSLNRLFDDAIAAGRLAGFPLDGLWLHVGTPTAIGEAEQAIAAYKKQPTV